MQFYCIVKSTVLGPKTSQYLMWPPFASRSATHLLRIELIRLLIVACGMLVHSSSMAVRSFWILAGTGTRCRIRRSRASQTCSMGDMSGEYAGHARTGMFFSFQELCTDPCNMGPCIIMLQHEVMVVDEWHNNGPQDLIMVSLCIQNDFNKMHLCSLSITYACPYHNPTTTMGHSIHSVDFSKPLTHTTAYTLSAICPVQWKPGFIHEENTSPKCQTPSNVSICPLKSVTTTNCSQVETPMRTTSMQMSFPETVSDSLCRNSLVMQTDCCSSCPGGWSQMILEVKMWMWRSWAGVATRGLRLWFRLDVLPNSLKRLWRQLMAEKWTFNSRATALVDIPAVSMPIAHSLKTCDICGIVLCDRTAHFRVAFYCGQPKAHLCNNHAV